MAHVDPQKFVYKHLSWISGNKAASGNEKDMNANGSVATPSIFEWEVGSSFFGLSRINFGMTDLGITMVKFGGIAALTNGCLFRVVNPEGGHKVDFTDGEPIKQNIQFALMAGVDVDVQTDPGEDGFIVRFSIFKAGNEMNLLRGDRVQFVVQDNLTGLSYFRCMVQGEMDTI